MIRRLRSTNGLPVIDASILIAGQHVEA